MLLWVKAEGEHEVTPVPPGVLTVGRSPDNDIAVGWDAELEPVHCMLRREGSAVWIRDAETGAGTWVDGLRLEEERPLEGGELIRIGTTELRFENQAVATSVAVRGVSSSTPRPVVRVATASGDAGTLP
jgi:pSer/pThr/pTyr-binding forkhead associated (FHA) protein